MQQFSLALDCVPRKVRAHGLREAHSYPMVSLGKQPGRPFICRRSTASEAWAWPQVEVRTPTAWPALILDLDGQDGTQRMFEAAVNGDVQEPNWTVTRRASGGSHAVWTLAKPVLRAAGAREAPLKAFCRVAEFYADTTGADVGYSGVLTHNPMAAAHGVGFVTTWGRREPYPLDELAAVTPLNWRRPVLARTAIGRNVQVFEALMRWAGSPRNLDVEVLAAAHVVNRELTRPLEMGELSGIAKSVNRYREQWRRGGYFYSPAESSAWGRRRGVASGKARRKGTPLEHDREPWMAAGMSRRTWYRRRRWMDAQLALSYTPRASGQPAPPPRGLSSV